MYDSDCLSQRSDKVLHQKRFLACYAASGSILKASRWSQIHRQTHYDWIRDDPEYPARFAAAEKEAARVLRDEAVRRAHEGLRKPVRYKGKIVGFDTEYSDTLLLALLKATDPESFRERWSGELTTKNKIPWAVADELLGHGPDKG